MNPVLKRVLLFGRNLVSIDIRVVATVLVSIAILHICATLVSPLLVESSAFRKLESLLPLNKMKILPPVRAGAQPLPFLSADVRYAMCRFDSGDGPVTVTAVLPDKGWTLSIHTPQGDNIYTAAGQEAHTSQVTLQLVASSNSFAGLTPESLGVSLSAQPVQSVEVREGVAILRAPDRGAAYHRNMVLAMRRAKCFHAKQ